MNSFLRYNYAFIQLYLNHGEMKDVDIETMIE